MPVAARFSSPIAWFAMRSMRLTSYNAPLSQHCLSCHEDGTPTFLPASGTDQTESSPFIGSNSAPIMSDAGLWTGASHNDSAAIGCVGCHVGHGSTRHSLLDPDPPVFAPDGGASNFDTDFCINCHDADGPSAKDISADLSYATQETTNSKNSSAFVNNRHDLRADDQTASTASIDCKDCHRPHADSQANPVRNPDDGSVLPLYDFNLGSYNGNAYSSAPDTSDPCNTTGDLDPLNPLGICDQGYTEPDMISFCVACHDNTLPAGTGATFATDHPPPTNMEASYFTDRNKDYHGAQVNSNAGQGMLKYPWNVLTGTGVYGMPPGEVDRPYAAMNCTTCHDAHGSGNIFNLRTSITVAGFPMQTGGWSGDTIGQRVTTDYLMPDTDGNSANGVQQEAFFWGAWCSFCHWMEPHGRSETAACNTGHRHMGGNF
jgi:predicted CXXCH cytochrome family protein